MNSITFALIPVLALIGSTSAFAGGDSSSGGGAVMCVENGRTVAKLFDLIEGEDNGLTIPRSTDPMEDQIEAALQKLSAIDKVTADQVRSIVESLDEKIDPVPEGKELPPPVDLHLKYLKKHRNCYLVSVADYNDATDRLQIDREIEAAMGPTDRAALRFHEAWYKLQRTGPAKVSFSDSARKLIAALFSDAPVPVVSPSQGLSAATFECKDSPEFGPGLFQFYVVPNSDGTTRLQFTKIGGRIMMDLTTIDLPRLAPDSGYAEMKKRLDHGGLPRTATNRRWDEPNSETYSVWASTKSGFEPEYTARFGVEDNFHQSSAFHIPGIYVGQFVKNDRLTVFVPGAPGMESRFTCGPVLK